MNPMNIPMQMMMNHEQFEPIWQGDRLFSLERYQANHKPNRPVILVEYDGDQATGRQLEGRISEVIRAVKGLADNYAILSYKIDGRVHK